MAGAGVVTGEKKALYCLAYCSSGYGISLAACTKTWRYACGMLPS